MVKLTGNSKLGTVCPQKGKMKLASEGLHYSGCRVATTREELKVEEKEEKVSHHGCVTSFFIWSLMPFPNYRTCSQI